MAKKTVEERRAAGLFWDRAWKLVEGCTKVSPGCDNCWSETETGMRSCHPNLKINARAGAVIGGGQGDHYFTGEILMRHDNLNLPTRIKKPTVFAIWNDLFHKDVDDDFIGEVYNMMFACPQHTFLILTKRAERMGTFLSEVGIEIPDHIWHGATVCNQEEADAKIPHLLKVPGKRFLSIEPMLGPIDLTGCLTKPQWGDLNESDMMPLDIVGRNDLIHQVILGGESGPGARPLHPNWVRGVRDQCASAGVPFMFKQDSGTRPNKLPELDGAKHDSLIWG